MKKILIENALDRKANQMIKNKLGLTDFQEIRNVLAKMLNIVPNARQRNGKYLLKTLEYYLNGELRDREQVKWFNWFLGNHYSNHGVLGDPNFNGLSFQELQNTDEYKEIMPLDNQNYDNAVQEAPEVRHINGYTIYPLTDEDTSYNLGGRFQEWCVTRGDFGEYGSDGMYLVRKDGFENVKPQTFHDIYDILGDNAYQLIHDMDEYLELEDSGDNLDTAWELVDEGGAMPTYFNYASLSNHLLPYDDYGLSSFVVTVGKNGRLSSCYSRYNLDGGRDGQFLTEKEVEQLIGVPFYKLFPYFETGMFDDFNDSLDSVFESKKNRTFYITERQKNILIKENIKIHKGEKGKNCTTQAKWADSVKCPHCGEKAYFSMSISDGDKGRGRIKVTDENGKEKDSEVQTIALYYCPNCYKFIAHNNMA